MPAPRSIWIGYDSREVPGFAVAKYSIRHFDRYTPIDGLVLSNLQERGIYTRPMREGINSDGRRQLIDTLSIRDDYDGSVSTEHSASRFLVPHLAKGGWAMFCDCDVMVLDNVDKAFALTDPSKALMCVHHDYHPSETVKMDGQLQTDYPRKNQSSVMMFNCDHPANRALTLEVVNTWPGRDLHAFKWLPPELIGELPPQWNYLVGVSRLPAGIKPSLIHFTRGLPDMAGYENQEYADDWRKMVPYAVGAL